MKSYELPINCIVSYGGQYVFSGLFERWLKDNGLNGKLLTNTDACDLLRSFGDIHRKFLVCFDNDDDALLFKLLWPTE